MAKINITNRANEVVTQAKEAATGAVLNAAQSVVPGISGNFSDLTNLQDLPDLAGIGNNLVGQGENLLNSGLQAGTDLVNQGLSAGIQAGTNLVNQGLNAGVNALAGELASVGVDTSILSDALGAPLTKEAKINANKFPNPLRQFATVNYIWSLSCLTTSEVNYPDQTYRVKPATVQILRSGGGTTAKALTAFETSDAQLEYFIDNVEIQTIISPSPGTRTSNATSVSFTVYEPYSMGLFLQTLMIAAKRAQGPAADYLKTPYLLQLEFIGYDDDGNVKNPAIAKRYIPIKFVQIDFSVDAGGCSYNVQAVPWNEQSQSTATQTLQQDVKLVGNNVAEILQKGPNSLTGTINKALIERSEKEETPTKDEYVIVFPPDLMSGVANYNAAQTGNADKPAMTPGEFFRQVTGIDPENAAQDLVENAQAEFEKYVQLQASDNNISSAIKGLLDDTQTINAIGKGTMASSMAEGGAVPFGRERFTVKEIDGKQFYANDQIQISKDFREFQFAAGTTIEKIIEEIVVLSSYAQNAATVIKEDPEGNLPWFRIQTQTYLVPDADWQNKTGENPKLYVYMVVPYKVHSSVFQSPTKPPPGATEKKISALKSYNYIYTGLNEDIIDFEIKFNNAFFNALSADAGLANAGVKEQTKQGTNDTNQGGFKVAEGGEGSVGSLSGNRILKSKYDATRPLEGGSDYSNTAIQVARQFNEAIVGSNVDLITMDLTVLGDPYYIADSGLGNYNSAPLITGANIDGTMDHQRGEVDVLVNFRTPIDYDQKGGGMIFPEDTVPVKAFSGNYKVVTVTNSFSGAKFTQVLNLIRRPNQDTDIGTEGTPGDNKPVTSAAKGETSLADNAAGKLPAKGNSSGTGDPTVSTGDNT